MENGSIDLGSLGACLSLQHFINLAAHISELHANSPEASTDADGLRGRTRGRLLLSLEGAIRNMTLTNLTGPFRQFTVCVAGLEWAV